MDKIKIPQCLVSYAGGSGGEWLAVQIGQHDKYYNSELSANKNEHNRWRMVGSWRQYLLDNTDIQDKLWTEQDYDNSEAWWKYYWDNAPDQETWYTTVREVMESKPQYTIPVHRCHEAWYDVFWRDLFEDFRIVTIRVDTDDERVFRQFQGNVIKKIFWQDFTEDMLEHEMRDKCRKHKTDYDDAKAYTDRFSGTINYTDMMLAVHMTKDPDFGIAVEQVLDGIRERWNDYNIKQHHYPIAGGYTVDFGRLLVDHDYLEYANMCAYLGMDEWIEDHWRETVQAYTKQDMEQVISIEDVEGRLWDRISELI